MANENDGGFLRNAKSGGLYGALVVDGTVTDSTGNALLGAVTETAPTTDTASSGLNGRLQRIAQRLTSLIALYSNATATLTNVNDTASSTTLLASNASRRGATIANDSTSVLYVKLGATASTTSFTVALPGNTNGVAYYEVPFSYTGIIDGIWSSDSTGAARMTEITA